MIEFDYGFVQKLAKERGEDVKYTPNRAERRAAQRAERAAQRRGQRAYDRELAKRDAELAKIKRELKTLSPEELKQLDQVIAERERRAASDALEDFDRGQ